MLEMLHSWANKMKEALIFLNHIKLLQIMLIEKNSKQILVLEQLQAKKDECDY